jgi:hypothetical protein
MTALSSEQAGFRPSALTMTPRLRKFALTLHVTFSVGWLGAVVAYLALAIAGVASHEAEAEVVRSAYFAMELTGWFVIVPLSLAALLTGLVQSLGTEWGLFRYYWVLVKCVLTVGAVTILLLHMPAVSRRAGVTSEVIHAGGGLLVLLATTALSVYKPWGKTKYGRHQQRERQRVALEPAATISTTSKGGDTDRVDLPSPSDSSVGSGAGLARESTTPWGLFVLVGVIALVLLFLVLHLTAGRLHVH